MEFDPQSEHGAFVHIDYINFDKDVRDEAYYLMREDAKRHVPVQYWHRVSIGVVGPREVHGMTGETLDGYFRPYAYWHYKPENQQATKDGR